MGPNSSPAAVARSWGSARPESITKTPSIDFATGDTLVLYTDGLIERRGEAIDVGIERLRRVIEGRSGMRPEDLCDVVLSEVALEDPEDDIALLVMQRRPTVDAATST